MIQQPLNPHGAPNSPRTDPHRVIEEIKRLAVEQLGNLPSTLYGPIEEAFNRPFEDSADASREGAAPLDYQDQAALWVLRQHQATHVMRFRQQIAQGFDDLRALRIRSRGDMPLGLIDESQLEFHLAGQRLAETVEQRFKQPLQSMDAGLRALSTVLGQPPAVNPIGATRLAAAFVETYTDEQIPDLLRQRLFQQYEQALLATLGELYERVNALLFASGYSLDTARTQAPARPAPPVAPPPQAPLSQAPQPSPAAARYEREERRETGVAQPAAAPRPAMPAPEIDPVAASQLGELRSLLHAWRGQQASPGADAPAPAPWLSAYPPARAAEGPRRELRVDEVVSVASLLQAEPVDMFARALAGPGRLGGAIREQLADGSRRLGLNPDQTRFSEGEEDAIDLVALLFDALFETHRMQERARRLYARLVLPYVKVALGDEALFVQQAHPARKLLDAITEACAGNNAETPQERELLDRAAAAAQKIVAEYNEDLTVFETAYAELDALLRQQRRRIELQEDRAAKATFGRERLNHAREQADAILARRLAAPAVSRAVADFLGTPWRHHLVQTLLREGADATRHAEAVALGDALVAADRLAGQGRGRELADHLLALQPAIIECFASSGLDQSAAEHGMAVLVKAFAYPDTPRDLYPAPAGEGGADESQAEAALWFQNEVDPARQDPALVEAMRAMQPGDWLQLTSLRGEAVEAKIAWVSPLSGHRLLVNRRGLRVLVASPEELAALGEAGRLQPSVERAAFDQAMQQVWQRLDRAVGQH